MSRHNKKETQVTEHSVVPVIVHANELETYTILDADAVAVATLEATYSDEGTYQAEEIIASATVSEEDGEEFQEADYKLSPTASTKTPKTFYCPYCGNCYSAAGSLKLHIRACVKTKDKEESIEERKCKVCNKVFNSATYLKEHMLRHAGQGPKKCSKCYRKFFDSEKYEAHLQSHAVEERLAKETEASGEKKFVKEYTCSFCNEQFTVVFDSRQTKRRYACDDCREKFSNEEMLKQHKQSLEEKREFRCEKCGRKFIFEGFLQRHLPQCDGTVKRKRDKH